MNPERLLKHFNEIAEAPDAIPRLRRFILDLAVRGKLVEQDPADEPAAKLLMKIEAEKKRLVEAGEIPKDKPLSPIKKAEVPFDIPQNWSWARLRYVASYIQRGKSPQYAGGEGRPVISQKCVQWDGLHLEWAKAITPESLESYEPIRFLRDGDLLWNSTGTGTIGRVVRVGHPDEGLVCDSHVTVVRCLLVDERFICIWLRSGHVYGTIEERAAGATNQVELTAGIANNQITPIPPLAEQHRIVAKVDELMALCDEMEAAQQKRERRRDRLVAATLNGLGMDSLGRDVSGMDVFGRPNDPNIPQSEGRDRSPNGPQSIKSGAFGESALPCETALPKFFLTHLTCLTTRPEHIQQFRQTILNLAVRGKLVPQDPNDEPAAGLLMRITTEKKKLMAGAEIAKSAYGSEVETISGPSAIPSQWLWVTWESIALKIGDIDHEMPETVKVGIPYISPRDFFPNNRIDFNGAKTVSEADFIRLSGKIKPDKGDIIYPRYGTIGENRLVDVQRNFLASYSCAVIKVLHGFINPKYQYFFSISDLTRGQAKAAENKATQANVGIKSIKAFRFPLPPLAEQNRIVVKVEELMRLCDELESQLNFTASNRRQLLEATLSEAIAPS
jgi:type I restriction enzyme S subunit